MNATAPEGYIYVCSACGKTSEDKYGDKAHSYGWDEFCMMHAVLCSSEKQDGRYMAVPE